MQYIRALIMHDAPDIAAAINNKRVQDNLRDGIPFPYIAADAESYIQGVLDAPVDSQYTFAIHFDGKAIGCIGVFRGSNVHARTAEMGYYIAEPYWGRGIMSNAVREVCAYVFENTDILRIYAEPFASNAASC